MLESVFKGNKRMFTRRSSAEIDDPCLSSETVSSLPRVGLRLCPGVVSTASLMLSIAISNTVPCRVLRDAVASLVKYRFSTVSKYSSCISCANITINNHDSTKFLLWWKEQEVTSNMSWQKPFASIELRSFVLFSSTRLRKVSTRPSIRTPRILSSSGFAPAKTCSLQN